MSVQLWWCHLLQGITHKPSGRVACYPKALMYKHTAVSARLWKSRILQNRAGV